MTLLQRSVLARLSKAGHDVLLVDVQTRHACIDGFHDEPPQIPGLLVKPVGHRGTARKRPNCSAYSWPEAMATVEGSQ